MSSICLLCKTNRSTNGKEHYVDIYKKIGEKNEIDVYDLKNIKIPLCIGCFKQDKRYSNISLLISLFIVIFTGVILYYYNRHIIFVIVTSSILRVFLYSIIRSFLPGNISEELDESRNQLKSDGRKAGTPSKKKNDKLNEIIDHREITSTTTTPRIFEVLIGGGFILFYGVVVFMIGGPIRYKLNPYYDYQKVDYGKYSFEIPQNRYKPLKIDSNVQSVFQLNPEIQYMIDNNTTNMISIQTKKAPEGEFKTIDELWNNKETKDMFMELLQGDEDFANCSNGEIKVFSGNQFVYYNCNIFNNDKINLYITSISGEIQIISFYWSNKGTRGWQESFIKSRINSIKGKEGGLALINNIESTFLGSFSRSFLGSFNTSKNK